MPESTEGISEIEADFDTIRLCLDLRGRYPDKREVFNRIIAMPLRKLLCERTGDSALERLCPGFKMFPLDGHDSNLQNNLHVILDIALQSAYYDLYQGLYCK